MNEQTQLKAMAEELASAGYAVERDLPGDKIAPKSTITGVTLDLVATLQDPDSADSNRPRLLVIEVANRRRAAGQNAAGRSQLRFAEDDEALARFKKISEALAKRRDAEFQIRFFDVSADQAAARELKGPIRKKATMQERITEAKGLLVRSEGRDQLSRALVIARLWAHWLRFVSHLHPGSKRSELRTADLRTIQKDLYDQQILSMQPRRYNSIHRSLLAAFEGGDVQLTHLLELRPEVERLLAWAADHYDVPYKAEQVGPDNLMYRLNTEIAERVPSPRRAVLAEAALMMGLTRDGGEFAKHLAGFLLVMGREPAITDELLSALLERAADIPSDAT